MCSVDRCVCVLVCCAVLREIVCVFGSPGAFASAVFRSLGFLFAQTVFACSSVRIDVAHLDGCLSCNIRIRYTPNEVGTNDRNDTDAQHNNENPS